ncbi:prenyltransferase [Alicyclobacillus sp.]|uniref:prenyltransferase n=1 Tax=Alicyclobacillus sp. TaxID=61169 RepID=UPI0025C0BF1E|nr:prenyltransferase [Alicyclobacillus sp.]MCL6517952.1 prenyltransferase [Alicyclobacillus sp.]
MSSSSGAWRGSPREYYRPPWWRLFRPLTFAGTLAPALFGAGLAHRRGFPPSISDLLLLLVACLLVQSACNVWNDVLDVTRGLDAHRWSKEAMDASGRRRISHHQAHRLAAATTGAAILCGLALALRAGAWVVPFGVAGLLAGYLYSGGPKPLSSMALGEITAFFLMGPVPAVLGYGVCTGPGDGGSIWAALPSVAVASLPLAFGIASMIWTNNLRDCETDRVCRFTLPMALGPRGRVWALGGILAAEYVALVGLTAARRLPVDALAAVLAIPLALGLIRAAATPGTPEVMRYAAWHHWAFGMLLAIAVW